MGRGFFLDVSFFFVRGDFGGLVKKLVEEIIEYKNFVWL